MGREHVTQLYNILLCMYMMITVTTLFCFSFFLSFSLETIELTSIISLTTKRRRWDEHKRREKGDDLVHTFPNGFVD